MAEDIQIDPSLPSPDARDFTVIHQKLDLTVSFRTQTIIGKTEIYLQPLEADLRKVRVHARQCQILAVSVEDSPAKFHHEDIYKRIRPHSAFKIRQYHLHRAKLASATSSTPAKELCIEFPPRVKVRQADQTTDAFQDKQNGNSGDLSALPDGGAAGELGQTYAPIKIEITFKVNATRDGLQFVGLRPLDARYPHVFTRNSISPGMASTIFPCLDNPQVRNTWEVSIKCARTLGDALGAPLTTSSASINPSDGNIVGQEGVNELNDSERAMEMTVVCSGEVTDELIDQRDPSMKSVSFAVNLPVSANQIGFAIGPFEAVELSNFREMDEDDKLGSNATQVKAYCLPGRSDEVRNTAMPLAKAIDFYTTSFTTYPFETFQMCFLDDMREDVAITAGLSLCSNRLLFPADIIDTLIPVTRTLIHALASQYAGICIAARENTDAWVISGIASFMTDIFMRSLIGNNEYRWNQKMTAEKVCQLDVERPSLHSLGAILDLDPSEAEFLALKSGVVLFILDRRLAKTGGSAGMTRIISRLLTNAKTSDADGTLVSTTQFQRLCEKMGHVKLDSFFNQWIHGAGCPIFEVRQNFNKKKLVVHIAIEQKQSKQPVGNRKLDPNDFLRDVKEETNEVWAGGTQNVFTGPMTIRIHEADGTPYEHIVEIKEATTNLEIPYNTKYKRLKRSKRQKERSVGNNTTTQTGEANDDVLLYCLGDVLQSKDEFEDWRLADWPEDLENAMGEESYEWIRMDADFEWICQMTIQMPSYMFVSQLQQDRDVVAQYESLKFMEYQVGNNLMATFLIRTVMDRRYFHGIREMAASLLPKTAKAELNWIGLFHLEKAFNELFCASGSAMTRPNDFSDRSSYLMQMSIPRAISKIKDNSGHAPLRVKRFFADKLRFNDNTDNEFSDCFYLSMLLECMTETLVVSGDIGQYRNLTIDDEVQEHEFHKDAMNEIERYRRIDEWIASYQNIFSSTALRCLTRLSSTDVVTPRLTDYLQYTRRGNADPLRIEAFKGLVEVDLLDDQAILRYLVHMLSHDPSPYIRKHLYQNFGRGLGIIATAERRKKKKKPTDEVVDDLVIEQEIPTDERAKLIARQTTIIGAIDALSKELAENEALQQGLWDAMSSPVLSLSEIPGLLTLCEILYEPHDAMIVKLQYPHFWKVKHLGKGKLRFTTTSKIRTKPLLPLVKTLNNFAEPAPPAPKPLISKINLSNLSRKNSFATTPSTPSTPGPTKLKLNTARRPSIHGVSDTPSTAVPPATPRRSLIVKLRISPLKLATIVDHKPSEKQAFAAHVLITTAPSIEIKPDPAFTGTSPSPATYGEYRPMKTSSPADMTSIGSNDPSRSSKKRKSETPQPGLDVSVKRQKSTTPLSSGVIDAPQFGPYVPPSNNTGNGENGTAPKAHLPSSSPAPVQVKEKDVPKPPGGGFKIKINMGGNKGGGH